MGRHGCFLHLKTACSADLPPTARHYNVYGVTPKAKYAEIAARENTAMVSGRISRYRKPPGHTYRPCLITRLSFILIQAIPTTSMCSMYLLGIYSRK